MQTDKRFKVTPKEKALHRVKILKGHLSAIEKMIERDEYCVDIVHQSLAVQKALRKLDLVLMENHLTTCVVHQINNGEGAKTTNELLKLFELK
ncbi:MAG: metal-sensing transcriptional repressor [Candidatus Dojkabacteria bacterium]